MKPSNKRDWLEDINQQIKEYIDKKGQNRSKLDNDIGNKLGLLNYYELNSLLDTIPGEAIGCIAYRFESFICKFRSKSIFRKLGNRIKGLRFSKVKDGGFKQETEVSYRLILHYYNEAKTKFLEVGDPKREEEIFQLFKANIDNYGSVLNLLDELDVFLLTRTLPKLISFIKKEGNTKRAIILIEDVKRVNNATDIQLNRYVSDNIHYGIIANFFPEIWMKISPVLQIIEKNRLLNHNDPRMMKAEFEIERHLPEDFQDIKILLNNLSKEDFEFIQGCLDIVFRKAPRKSTRKFIRRMAQKYPDLNLISYWSYDSF